MRSAILAAVALLAWQAAAPTPLPEGLHVQLSLRDGKTRFRAGEPIRAVLTVSADKPDYFVDNTTTNPASPIDDVVITPDVGLFHWLDRYAETDRYAPDYSGLVDPTRESVQVLIPLNQWVRFDTEGDYTVQIKTRRIRSRTGPRDLDGPALTITTNAVSFHVDLMSDAEEAAEAQRLSALLDIATKDLKLQEERCQDLGFLPGDHATREKVRQYFKPDGHIAGNWTRDLSMGFFISRRPELILSRFEDAMADVSVPTQGDWITQAAVMRQWIETLARPAPLPSEVDRVRSEKARQWDAVRKEYVDRLAESLTQRTGRSRLYTAEAVLVIQGGRGLPMPAEVRQVIVDEFDSLPSEEQGALVSARWKEIRDPKLVPALRALLAAPGYLPRTDILKALTDIDPDSARSGYIAEIINPRSTADVETLKGLSAETLPEVDAPLLEQVKRFAEARAPRDEFFFSKKTALLARYATGAIRADVLALVRANGNTLPVRPRSHLIAYLIKWDEPAALSLLEETIATGRDVDDTLHGVTELAWSPGLDAIVRRRLESDVPRAVYESALRLSQHGNAADRSALQARLNRWTMQWGPRRSELEAEPRTPDTQSYVQAALIQALVNGHGWTLTAAEIAALKASCITAQCRSILGVK